MPPSFNIYRFEHEQKPNTIGKVNNGIFDKDVKIPTNWNGPSPGMTRTQLIDNHRSSFVPHASFDLDGDGIVGNRDLVMAKLFDKDNDGILNEQERK